MRLLFLILADSAQLVEGKLYMLGGAWNQITSATFPTRRPCSVAIGLAPEQGELNVPHSLRLALASVEDGTETDLVQGEFQIGVPADALPGTEPRVVTTVPLVLTLNQAGRYAVKSYVDGRELQSEPFVVAPRSQ